MKRYVIPPDFVLRNIRTLRKSRTDKGLSIAELADETNVNNARISSYEVWGQKPQQENYNKLAKYFGWSKWE